MYLQRDIENCLKKASESFEAIVVYGARQVGKSTTAIRVFKKASLT